MDRKKFIITLLVGLILLCITGSTILLANNLQTHSIAAITPVATGGSTPQATAGKRKSTPTMTPGQGLQLAGHSKPTPTPTPTPVATPTPATTMTPTPAPTTGGSSNANWTLIYSDDFLGTQLNSQWITYNGPHGGGQSYYDPSELTVSNGLLYISEERKTTNGLPYTTGGLGLMRLSQVYGKYEMRVKLPHGKGVGPYAILWPQSEAPNTAQVDIFESPPPNKGTIYFTNHATDGTSSQLTANNDFADDFHIITCEWTPGQLRLLVDGVQIGVLTQGIFTQPMWFGIAISSGDAFTGLPDSTTILPVSMEVDWIHVYKYNG